MTDLTIDIGIDESDRRTITEGLSRLLADIYTLYHQEPHNYHWNVTGPMFRTLAPHVRDAIRARPRRRSVAERIRALGARTARASYREFTAGCPQWPTMTTCPTRPR